jgi:hypothetical protein
MSEKTNASVRKLLRVLVAGGVALAGSAGARAEDQPGAAPTEKTDQAKQQQQQQSKDDAQKAKAEKDQKDKDAQKKKADEQKKAADSEGGGVKGW